MAPKVAYQFDGRLLVSTESLNLRKPPAMPCRRFFIFRKCWFWVIRRLPHESAACEEAPAAMCYELEDTIPVATVDHLLETIIKCKVVIEQRGLMGSMRRH